VSLDEASSDDDAAEPASEAASEGLVLRQASLPARQWDAGPDVGGSFAAVASSTVEIQREASPLVYRRSAFAAPPSSQAAAAMEPSSAAIEQVLRQVERGGTIRSTISAPPAYIQRQLAEEGGAEAAAPAMDATAEAPAQPATAGGAATPEAAAAPAEAVAAVSNQALERLAREIYDRLRRRLIVERERAGIGTAMS
jgi:hypothetical protein